MDLDVIQVGISYYIGSVAFLVFPAPFDCSSDQLLSAPPVLAVHGCRHVDACIRYSN